MKPVLLQTVQLYIFGAAVSGSIYRLLESNNQNESLKYAALNLIILLISFVISYFGYKTIEWKSGKK